MKHVFRFANRSRSAFLTMLAFVIVGGFFVSDLTPVIAEETLYEGDIPLSIEPCGTVDYGDGQLETLENCEEFADNEPVPGFSINGMLVENNGSYVIGSRTKQYGVPGENYFIPSGVRIFEREGNNYTLIDTSFQYPSRAEVEKVAIEFLDGNIDRGKYFANIFLTDYKFPFFYQDRDTPLVDGITGRYLYEVYEEVEAYIYQNVQSDRMPLVPGTYTAVIILSDGGGVQQSFLSPFLEFLIPKAHAFYGGSYVTNFTLLQEQPEVSTGASSILFLPGIQASRLYTESALGTEDRLWEPIRNQDLSQLAMTPAGESVNDVYTRDVIGKALGIIPIYDNFLEWLESQKEQEIINDYVPFAYDWRYAVDDVVEDGVQYENEVRSLINQTRALASDSYTGKVTIIGHSNGGLLAKALMTALEEVDDADLVDRVILLGSPQLGTPEAIGTVLHGYDQTKAFGFIVDGRTAREVINNLPGAYGLLPSAAYFDQTEEPVIRIDEDEFTDSLRLAYDRAISEHSVLQDFLLGTRDSREDPKELYELGTANSDLLAKTTILHNQILDSWVAPEGVDVVEIVGTGLPTVKGFRYRQYQNRFCFHGGGPAGPTSCTVVTTVKPTPIFTLDGDGTVVTASAKGYEGEKQTFYLNIDALSDDERVEHADLSEAPVIQSLVGDLIENDLKDGYSSISKISSSAASGYTVISSHSPVTISVTDSKGNKIATTYRDDQEYLTSEIPGGYYFTIGGSRYVLVPDNQEYEVLIEGTDDGLVTIELEYLDSDTQTILQRVVVPEIRKGTKITTSVTDEAFEVLEVDLDGEGTVDQRIDPQTGLVTQIQPEVATSTPARRSSGGGGGGNKLSRDIQGVVAGDVTTQEEDEHRQKLKIIVVLLQKLLSLLITQNAQSVQYENN